jgi:hypothetical protein
LVKEAGFFSLPENRLSRLPDVQQYEVSIEDDGGRERTIHFDDKTAEPSLLDLVDKVSDLTRSGG